MKKLFVLVALLGLVSLTADAQKCCASKAGTTSVEGKASCSASAASKAASLEENITKRVSNDGTETYVRKSVCSTSGKVSFTEVEYCTKSAKFINVAPGDKKSCTKEDASSSSTTSSKKVSTSTTKADSKACCSGKEASAACCAGKKATDDSKASTTKAADADVKLAKNESN